MNRTSTLLRIALFTCFLPVVSSAQEAPKPLAHAYRLTYTLTLSDAGKRIGVQHITLTVGPPTGRGTAKLGDKIPVVTGGYYADGKPTEKSNQYQVTYLDVGTNIDATVIEDSNGVVLRTKVEQSSFAAGPSYLPSDPIVRQVVLDNESIIHPDKPLILGSLDSPDSTRHYDIEVLVEQML